MHSITTSVRPARPVALIRVCGEVDLLAEPDLRQAAAIVVEAGCSDVVLDLNDVSFLDCAGLRALISCRDRVEASGGQLRLGPTSHVVSRLLTLTRCREGWVSAAAVEV